MAFFPMTQFDFPNATYFDSNLREIIYKIKQLVANYNEVVEQFNQIQAEFEEFRHTIEELPSTIKKEVEEQLAEITPLIYDYLDMELDKVRTSVETVALSVSDLDSRLTAEINAVDSKLTLRINNVDIAWRSGDITLDNKFTQITEEQRREYLSKIAEISRDIEALQWDLPKIYNIVEGTHDSITKVLYDVYDAVRVHAITAGDYDALSWTAIAYDSFDMTAIEFDVESEHILVDRRPINPATGERDELQNILFSIMEYATGEQGLTAEVYDSKEFSAERYDGLEISAFMYDYFGKQILL